MQGIAIEIAREQGLEAGERGGARDLGEDVAEVGVGLKPAGLGGLEEAVEVGAGVCAADGVGEEPVLAADDDAPFILPMSARRSRSTTRGTRSSAARSRCWASRLQCL